MIDWLTFQFQHDHAPLPSGRVIAVDSDGQELWCKPQRTVVMGSHESAMTIISTGGDGQGSATGFTVSGNPVKFLQGHNCFGSDDLVGLAVATVRRLDEFLGLGLPAHVYRSLASGQFTVSTVDITFMHELPSQADVMAWIRAAEYKSRSRCGRPTSHPGTLYWQKKSKRWALKCYSKLNEIEHGGKGHKLPDTLGIERINMLTDWVANKLRIELRLKKKEMTELGIESAAQLQSLARELFAKYVGQITMVENMQLSDELREKLPLKVYATYTLWREGHDLRSTLTRPTYYRHRRELLAHGIDITIAPDPQPSNVIPLIRVLEARPVENPEWADKHGLIFNPSNEVPYVRAVGY